MTPLVIDLLKVIHIDHHYRQAHPRTGKNLLNQLIQAVAIENARQRVRHRKRPVSIGSHPQIHHMVPNPEACPHQANIKPVRPPGFKPRRLKPNMQGGLFRMQPLISKRLHFEQIIPIRKICVVGLKRTGRMHPFLSNPSMR